MALAVLCLALNPGGRIASDSVRFRRPVRVTADLYPCPVVSLQEPAFENATMPSGIVGLDRHFVGRLDRSTCTLVGAHSRVGKTSLVATFLAAAVARGERGMLYRYDEGPTEVDHRSEAIGPAVRAPMERDPRRMQEVDPLGLPPEQFCDRVRADVEHEGTRLAIVGGVQVGRRMALTVTSLVSCDLRKAEMPIARPWRSLRDSV